MRQFFEESNGNLSAMRLYCFVALIVAAAITFTSGAFESQVLWIVAAFAPKAVQKYAEKK